MADILAWRRGTVLEENQRRASRLEQRNLPVLLLRMAIDTATLSGRPFSLALVREILASAPHSQQELAEDDWAAASVCWQCLEEAEGRMFQGALTEMASERLVDFWSKDFIASMERAGEGRRRLLHACSTAITLVSMLEEAGLG